MLEFNNNNNINNIKHIQFMDPGRAALALSLMNNIGGTNDTTPAVIRFSLCVSAGPYLGAAPRDRSFFSA